MALTGKELREVDLTQTIFRGYKIAEVDDVLERAAQALDDLHSERDELAARVEDYAAREQKVQDMELTLRDTLLTAQRAAEDVVQSSREKAAAILADCELEGRRILARAEDQVEEAKLRQQALETQAVNLKSMLRRLISDQLRLLEQDYPEAREGQRTAADEMATREFSPREVLAAQAAELDEPEEPDAASWEDGYQLEEHGHI